MTMNIGDLRQDYNQHTLDISDVLPNPFQQFDRWFNYAINQQVAEPNAMYLSTVLNEKPSGRIVLLKDFNEQGFCFFTNYQSRKGQALAQNSAAALTFFWLALERQVHIEGVVAKVSPAESDAYFASRPRGSQLGAWVSEQSHVIQSRQVLEERQQELEAKFLNQPILRPEHWGGYRLVPTYLEFWQGRSSRLHDRIAYTKTDQRWVIERLAP